MSTAQLRRRARRQIGNLPDDSLRSAVDFIDYLEEKRRTEFLDRIRKAERELAAGGGVPVEKLRRKYKRV